ncbi:hypothetical protein ABZ725_41990 [Streptomyces sp. NPDC006872]|uniref:hypothetical protein n=1 Tax=Streptomyces sp. NPDC006872 TaxID=3155720 RepID=UPI0033FE4CCF
MRVRITAPGAGLLDLQPFPAVGEVVELPEGLAVSLLNDSRAELVAGAAAETRETRTVDAPEKRGPGRPRKSV